MKKKTYIILIVIMFVFLMVMFFVFGLDEIRKRGYNTTLVVENDTVWTYSNKSWKNASSYDKLNWKKFDVYSDNEKIGNYYLWNSDYEWYVFDNNKNAITIDGSLLGINSNTDISVYNFEVLEIDDYSYVYEVLKKNNLPTDSKYTSNEKIVFDYDNDGINEEFYLITNAFAMDFDSDKIFSIVFMGKDDEIYSIYTNISENTGFNGCKPYFSSFIDIDNDSKYEFILSCAKYSTSSVTRMLYGYNDNKFKMLISNNK